ncbi:MAG TPA: hypothetical protein VKQ08_01045 [Cyclobacteriaceae bacterium]|nr:hypothetical protein [Cyclobacteriaceae bacterium]
MSLCISLAQPYASLLIAGIKRFETRGWRPGPRNLAIIQREGLLVHASLSRKYDHLQATEPFWRHLSGMGQLPRGAIIGRVRVGEIIPTEKWIKDYATWSGSMSNLPGFFERVERNLGDFSAGRYAWQILDPVKFDAPIPYKGSLSLWNYPNKIKQSANGLSLICP